MSMRQYSLILIVCMVSVCVHLGWNWYAVREKPLATSISNLESKQSHRKCEQGFFILPGMDNCLPLLGCTEIRDIDVTGEVVGVGAVKRVRRGRWQGRDVAVNTLVSPSFAQDFLHGLRMLRELPPAVTVTQLVGFCEVQRVFVTELHVLGSLDRLEAVLRSDDYRSSETASLRFSLCQQYVAILHALHTADPRGARVMCDTNDLEKTLSQFLLRDDLSLVLNDVDALPLAVKTRDVIDKKHDGLGKTSRDGLDMRRDDGLVKCGHRELFGQFVAPEQLWPSEDRDFSDALMEGYDEKTDVWKVPDVCEALLGRAEGGGKVRLHLLQVHLRCKHLDPAERPSAGELVNTYQHLRTKLWPTK